MRGLNIHSICRSINKLCDFLDSRYDINQGGCCFIAYTLAARLDKLGISYNLVVYDYFKKDPDDIQHEVSNKVKNKFNRGSVIGNCTCSHYSLHITGGGEINGGDFDDYNRYIIKNVKSSDIRWIYHNGRWNIRYNPHNNRIIKGIIKSFFKQYETFSIRQGM